jgi:hypothetical protein
MPYAPNGSNRNRRRGRKRKCATEINAFWNLNSNQNYTLAGSGDDLFFVYFYIFLVYLTRLPLF